MQIKWLEFTTVISIFYYFTYTLDLSFCSYEDGVKMSIPFSLCFFFSKKCPVKSPHISSVETLKIKNGLLYFFLNEKIFLRKNKVILWKMECTCHKKACFVCKKNYNHLITISVSLWSVLEWEIINIRVKTFNFNLVRWFYLQKYIEL